MIFYLAAYDRLKADAIVRCPACGAEIGIAADELEKGKWISNCQCGAAFGVINAIQFSSFVKQDWVDGKPSGQPKYCDFFVREPRNGYEVVYRWHGWVDPESRKIVQVG